MVSESETKGLEVKKARTRRSSKPNRDAEKESKDTPNEGGENDEPTNTLPERKTRHGKRSSDKKETSGDSRASSLKKSKKESAMFDEDASNDVQKPKKPSKRQLKREKEEERERSRREALRKEATEKALNYISKWKHAKSEWKFEKLRQIWLIDNLLNDKLIPDNIFPTVLEYFEGCKGMAREQLLKKGMDVVRKQEDAQTTESSEPVIENVEYNRARQLLQALPTET